MKHITIITPTIGRASLDILIDTVDRQSVAGVTTHLLLWDDVRDPAARAPESYEGADRHSIVFPAGFGFNGKAPGSPLRAVGLLAARTPWVTFADDDVWWHEQHVEALGAALPGNQWASTLRTIWAADGQRLGVDRFESVGDDPTRSVAYEMLDNNCMIFARPLAVAATGLYRETVNYNDDRLMYAYLKKYAGRRGRTNRATVNQICPDGLTDIFRANCASE
jgi:hypothetical protein